MKRLFAIVLTAALLCGVASFAVIAAEPVAPVVKGQTNSNVWVCPMPLTADRSIHPDFINMLTDKTKWPTVYEKTGTIKLFIEQLYRSTDDDLAHIGAFVRESGFTVAVELGGIRIAPPGIAHNQVGQAAAENEYAHLERFLRLGGRVDYITTDHAMSEYITGLKDDWPGMAMQDYIREQIVYFQYMQTWIPGLRCGAIESLGYFCVNGGRPYQPTAPMPNQVAFETYFDEYLRIAKSMHFTLDHFHIDFGMHDVEHDGSMDSPDYGRIIAVERYVKSKGVCSGFIAANAFHNPLIIPAPDEAAASQSAADRTLLYFEQYVQAGGESDTLILQRWQPYPVAVGDEDNPLSSMGIFKAIVTSEWFNLSVVSSAKFLSAAYTVPYRKTLQLTTTATTGKVTYQVKDGDSAFVTVNSCGLVTSGQKGCFTFNKTSSAQIEVLTNGVVTDTCTVTVTQSFWQWLFVIVAFGWVWY